MEKLDVDQMTSSSTESTEIIITAATKYPCDTILPTNKQTNRMLDSGGGFFFFFSRFYFFPFFIFLKPKASLH